MFSSGLPQLFRILRHHRLDALSTVATASSSLTGHPSLPPSALSPSPWYLLFGRLLESSTPAAFPAALLLVRTWYAKFNTLAYSSLAGSQRVELGRRLTVFAALGFPGKPFTVSRGRRTAAWDNAESKPPAILCPRSTPSPPDGLLIQLPAFRRTAPLYRYRVQPTHSR